MNLVSEVETTQPRPQGAGTQCCFWADKDSRVLLCPTYDKRYDAFSGIGCMVEIHSIQWERAGRVHA